jgi:glutamyl-tRNA reductase
MKTSHRRFTTQEKLAILSEADQFGTAHVVKIYNLSTKVLSRWQKDLNSSKSRQASIKKESESQTIESLKAEIERLKKMVANQAVPVQRKEQKSEMSKRTASEKEKELLHLVATLIVEKVLKDLEEEFGPDDLIIRDSNLLK